MIKTLKQLTLTALTICILVGCRATVPPSGSSRRITEIRIESQPQGWGYAYKTVKQDGAITGGHMSGGPDATSVFENKSQVTVKDMSSLEDLVSTVAAQPANPQPPQPDQKLDGFTSVVVTFNDGSSLTFFAKVGQRFQPDSIQTMFDIIHRYNVGAW